MTQKKIFSRIGTAYFLLTVVSLGVSYLLAFVLAAAAPRVYYRPLMTWVLSLLPMYLVGMPVCAKVMKRLPGRELFQKKMSPGNWVSAFCICICVMYAGNLLGNFISTMIGEAASRSVEFSLQEMMTTGNLAYTFVFSVLLAPVLEELFFRKILIDRAIVFGDKTAILLSGLLFGLFHGNFYQVFYAFGVGCVLAYVYIRTGKIWYSISLHMAVNFFNGFLSASLLRNLDLETLLDSLSNPLAAEQYLMENMGILMLYVLFAMVMLVLAIIGLVKLLTSIRRLHFNPGEYSAPSQTMAGYLFGNVGMWLFIGICAVEFFISIL